MRHNKVWQTQRGHVEIYLYSAYYDDRPALTRPCLRIIGIAETHATNLVCLIWYHGQGHPDVSRAQKKEVSSKISPQLEKRYEAYVFTCNMLQNKTTTPEGVSLVTTLHKVPTNLLTVQYPVKPSAAAATTTANASSEAPLQFGHCMSILYWSHKPYRIVEWLELHRMWGVAEFNIYYNTLDARTLRVLRHYEALGLLRLQEMTSVLDNDLEWTILLNMSPAINDCLYRNMYRYRNVVCTDTDEMIVPIMHRNYSTMLAAVNQQQHVTHAAPSYIFRNVYFFTDFGPVRRTPVVLHTQRYTKHVNVSTFGYSAKSFTNPLACSGLQNHICWQRLPALDTYGWLVDVKQQYGMNFHYKKCHFDDYLQSEGECSKMMRDEHEATSMHRFKPELLPRVRTVLKLLNML